MIREVSAKFWCASRPFVHGIRLVRWWVVIAPVFNCKVYKLQQHSMSHCTVLKSLSLSATSNETDFEYSW